MEEKDHHQDHHIQSEDDDDDHHGAAELLHDDLVEGKFPHSREGSGRALPEEQDHHHGSSLWFFSLEKYVIKNLTLV